LADFTFGSKGKNLLEFWQEWAKVFQAVGLGLEHDDSDGELRDVLLKGQVTVDGHGA